MAKKVSLKNIKDYSAKVARLKASSKRAREKAGETMATAIKTSVTGGTAFAFGYAQEKYKSVDDKDGGVKTLNIMGVPVELAVAGIAHASALMGVGSGMESYIKAAGDGALAAYAVSLGQGFGKKSRHRDGKILPGESRISGMLGASERTSDRLSNRELENLANLNL